MEDGGGVRSCVVICRYPLPSMDDPRPSSQSTGSQASESAPLGASAAKSERPAKPITPAKPAKRWRRRVLWLAAILLALLVTGELVARYAFGLGDPPLSVADPEIEYLFKPNQTCRRFGNRIHYNAYSMRSDDFPPHKSRPGELRVLVIGDSVVNGGAHTDQSELATSLLARRLEADLGRPVVVGNVSAGSWGPPNMLAYVKRFGLFDADVVVIVLSSHDYADVPTFEPLVGISPGFPDRKPVLALQEVLTNYLPRFLRRFGSQADSSPEAAGMPSPAAATQKDIDECLRAEAELFRLARSAGAAVILAQHLEGRELSGAYLPGHGLIRAVAAENRVPVVQLGPAFKASLEAGQNPYWDPVHPNAVGQRVIADALLPVIEEELRRSHP